MSDLRSDLSEMESEPFQNSGLDNIVDKKVSKSDDTEPEEESAGSTTPKQNDLKLIKVYLIKRIKLWIIL